MDKKTYNPNCICNDCAIIKLQELLDTAKARAVSGKTFFEHKEPIPGACL